VPDPGASGAGGDESGAGGDANGGGEAGAGGEREPATGGTSGAGSGGDAGTVGEAGGAGASGSSCVIATAPNTATSCADLPATCGAGSASDCCASARLAGGDFNRSNDELYPATLCPFELDVYEVSVGRFRKFMAAYPGNMPATGSGANPNDPLDTGWDAAWNANLPADQYALKDAVTCHDSYETWTDTAGANETRPMTCLSWYVASAFCIWDGGRLPTEAEWNFAASGGDDQRYYPWSDPAASTTITEAHASYYVDDTRQCGGDGVDGCTVEDFVPVGSKSAGAGRFGHFDLSGNVWEWVKDYWGGYPPSCENCMNRQQNTIRMVRGGGIDTSAVEVTTLYRGNGTTPERYDAWTGVRCARTARAE
jgi:formylglycine-generating enzyme required for sulfatase activity